MFLISQIMTFLHHILNRAIIFSLVYLCVCMCGLWICALGGHSRMLCILICFLLTPVTRSFAEPRIRLVACSPRWWSCLWLTTAVQASTQLFKCVLRIWTQVLMLVYWAFSHFPSLIFVLKKQVHWGLDLGLRISLNIFVFVAESTLCCSWSLGAEHFCPVLW